MKILRDIFPSMSAKAIACAVETNACDSPTDRAEQIDDATDMFMIRKLQSQIETIEQRLELRKRNSRSQRCGKFNEVFEVNASHLEQAINETQDDGLRAELEALSDEDLNKLNQSLQNEIQNSGKNWIKTHIPFVADFCGID